MKIAEKIKVLNGRGMIISYANGNSAGKYYYKELIEGTKKYRTKLIKGAGTLKQAEELAPYKRFVQKY